METPSGDIAFLYLRDGEVINIKFRSLEKRFHQACVLPLPPPCSVWRDPSLFSMPAPRMHSPVVATVICSLAKRHQ